MLECVKAKGEVCVVMYVKGMDYSILMTTKSLYTDWKGPFVRNPVRNTVLSSCSPYSGKAVASSSKTKFYLGCN